MYAEQTPARAGSRAAELGTVDATAPRASERRGRRRPRASRGSKPLDFLRAFFTSFLYANVLYNILPNALLLNRILFLKSTKNIKVIVFFKRRRILRNQKRTRRRFLANCPEMATKKV